MSVELQVTKQSLRGVITGLKSVDKALEKAHKDQLELHQEEMTVRKKEHDEWIEKVDREVEDFKEEMGEVLTECLTLNKLNISNRKWYQRIFNSDVLMLEVSEEQLTGYFETVKDFKRVDYVGENQLNVRSIWSNLSRHYSELYEVIYEGHPDVHYWVHGMYYSGQYEWHPSKPPKKNCSAVELLSKLNPYLLALEDGCSSSLLVRLLRTMYRLRA